MKRGITLVEVMIVLAIVIIAGVTVFMGLHDRQKAREERWRARFQQEEPQQDMILRTQACTACMDQINHQGGEQ